MWRVAWHVTCREWRGVERLAGAESRIGPPSALKIEIFCFSGGRPTTAASRDHDPCATNPEGGWANQRCRPCRPHGGRGRSARGRIVRDARGEGRAVARDPVPYSLLATRWPLHATRYPLESLTANGAAS